MAKASTQKTKPAQKKIYDPQVNELRRQVNLSFERLMCQASGPKELKELQKETGRVLLRQQDYDKVIKLFKNGAKQGDAEAQYNLGYMYENGKGVEGDYVIAAEWYEKAAAQGHAKAQNNLAFLYRKGYGVPQDIDKAIELYEKSAGQGCTIAQTNLGYLYKYGTEVGQDYVKAAEWFRKAAEQGNPTGQVNLAELYDEGKGVPQDYAEAAKWYIKAAEQGIKPAAKRLGELYEKGLGVPQDSTKAAYWSKEGIIRRSWIYNWGTSIKRGSQCGSLNKIIERVTDPTLKNSLIKIKDEYWNKIEQLNKPDFTNEDMEQIRLEHKHMEDFISKMEELIQKPQEDAEFQNELGCMYFEGKDVEQDYGKAAECFLKAANQGHANAQRYLGYMYYHGKGVEQDYGKAAEYWRKAAEQGIAVAQFNLGYVYDSGEGVEQDYAKAAEWFEKAAEQGDEEAADKLREIYEKTQPARYILMCDYPGLWFRTFIDASKLGFSYTEQHEYYVRSLEDVIARVLEEQVRKAIYALYYPEDDVKPMGHFDYYDVEKIIKSYIPYNENVEATLITIDKENNIIETKTIKVLEFLDNDPDYFREYGVSEAVYQYIATALRRFENEAGWHYALKKENGYIETVKQWPVPQKDGSWIDADGTVLQPYVWFGVKGNEPDSLWSLYGDMSEDDLAFWFSEDPLEYIIENDEEIYSFFRGQAPKQEIDRPDMENILRKCPVSVDEDDDPESIKEKIQAFFLNQYRNR